MITAAAQESWRQARSELEPFLKEQPENYNLMGDLALTNMALGDKAAAFAFVEKAIAERPDRQRRTERPCSNRDSCRVSAQMGEPDRAVAAFTEAALDAVRRRRWLTCRSLLRCSGSIRCSIRSETIRASKNSAKSN